MPDRLPPFIDSVHAAEALRTTVDAVLDLVRDGRLKPYGGKASNPIFRSGDVLALVDEIGALDDAEAPRRIKSAANKVQTRLTADARWSDVGDQEIREWALRADRTRHQAARTAATRAIERLQLLLAILDESI